MSEPILSSNSCPKCGAALPSAATAGLCPRCLMAEAMAPTQPETGPAAARKPLAPEELAPHFPQLEILECLGRGGMGVVYKARQKTLNRFVALKLLAPERVREPKFAERFAREAQALAALNHPNIVTIYDFGQAGGFYYLLMEFVDGVNLRQLLRARKFTPEEALAIVPPLCDALQFAHDRGIVHRDIKPENLLLDKTGRVKVADFGIAKMIEPDAGRAGLPVSPDIAAAQEHGATGIVGTPNYTAPEQKTDPGRVDSRADIYSLGVVFYEMLTGELPGKRLEPPSRKVHIDVRLDEVVLRALEQNPALRYQQVSEVKTMVETIVQSPETPFSPPRMPPKGWGYRSKQTAFGIPLFDMASGVNPATGCPAMAKGIVAIGPSAMGLIAIGFEAAGVFAIGLLSLGIFPIGLLALGVLCSAGIAAFGKMAIGVLAVASEGVGVFAIGKDVAGLHSFPSNAATAVIYLAAFFAAWLIHQTIKQGVLARAAAQPKNPAESGKLETAPRFSRTAIAGACFGMVGLLALVLILFGRNFFVLGNLAFPFYTVAASMALCMLLFTTLGWVAVSQIKRSAGRLRGLWLAQIERLLFPMLFLLLVLDFLIIYSQAYITIETLHMDAFMNHAAPPPFHVTQATSIVPYESLVRIASAFICAVSNTLIAWGVWRAVNIGSPPPPPAASKNSGFGKLALGLFLVGTIGSFLLAIIGDGRGKLAAECASVALTLALILGLLNWRERLGKFAALATTGLFVALLLLAAHVRFVIVPAWWDRLQASFGPVTECTLPMDEDGWTPLFDLDYNLPIEDLNPGDSNNIISAAQATTDTLKYVRDVSARANLKRPGMAFQHDARKKIINCTAMSGMTVGSATDDQWGRITALAQVSGTLLEVGTELGGTQPYNAPDDPPQTIFLRTGQHRLGILQVTDFNDSEHWLKIRYKLAPQAPPQSIGVRLISFGPIIERVVADSKADFKTEAERTNAPMMIDFDSGSLLAGPAAIWAEDTKDQRAWMETNGVDALGVIPQVNGLVALDMKVAAVPPSAWDMVPEPDFTNQLAGVTARETTGLSGQVGSVSTWYFQTRKGRMGVLQITGLAENPPGVKIRYKLAQEWGTITPAGGNTASNQEPQNFQWQPYPSAAAAPAAPPLSNAIPVLATAAYNGDIAVRLDSLGNVESSNTVTFPIAENYAQQLVKRFDAGQVLTVEAEGGDGKPFGRGSLRGVDNQIDTATGTIKCTATLAPDGDNLMLRGLFLNIHLTLEVKHGVTLVPFEAIQHDAEGAFVWVIKPDQTVSRRRVEMGARDGAKAEIQSGLSPGELVVIGPLNNLRDGQKISYKLAQNSGATKTNSAAAPR